MAWDQSRTARLLQTVEKRVRWVSDGSVLARGVESLATTVGWILSASRTGRTPALLEPPDTLDENDREAG